MPLGSMLLTSQMRLSYRIGTTVNILVYRIISIATMKVSFDSRPLATEGSHEDNMCIRQIHIFRPDARDDDLFGWKYNA
jgi:hypothetical protein